MHEINFESIFNYYQRMVYDHILAEYGESELAIRPGALEDVACLALNQLPPRYVRHGLDTTFYISKEERQEMLNAVEAAVERAAEYVFKNPREIESGEVPRGELQ